MWVIEHDRYSCYFNIHNWIVLIHIDWIGLSGMNIVNTIWLKLFDQCSFEICEAWIYLCKINVNWIYNQRMDSMDTKKGYYRNIQSRIGIVLIMLYYCIAIIKCWFYVTDVNVIDWLDNTMEEDSYTMQYKERLQLMHHQTSDIMYL